MKAWYFVFVFVSLFVLGTQGQCFRAHGYDDPIFAPFVELPLSTLTNNQTLKNLFLNEYNSKGGLIFVGNNIPLSCSIYVGSSQCLVMSDHTGMTCNFNYGDVYSLGNRVGNIYYNLSQYDINTWSSVFCSANVSYWRLVVNESCIGTPLPPPPPSSAKSCFILSTNQEPLSYPFVEVDAGFFQNVSVQFISDYNNHGILFANEYQYTNSCYIEFGYHQCFCVNGDTSKIVSLAADFGNYIGCQHRANTSFLQGGVYSGSNIRYYNLNQYDINTWYPCSCNTWGGIWYDPLVWKFYFNTSCGLIPPPPPVTPWPTLPPTRSPTPPPTSFPTPSPTIPEICFVVSTSNDLLWAPFIPVDNGLLQNPNITAQFVAQYNYHGLRFANENLYTNSCVLGLGYQQCMCSSETFGHVKVLSYTFSGYSCAYNSVPNYGVLLGSDSYFFPLSESNVRSWSPCGCDSYARYHSWQLYYNTSCFYLPPSNPTPSPNASSTTSSSSSSSYTSSSPTTSSYSTSTTYYPTSSPTRTPTVPPYSPCFVVGKDSHPAPAPYLPVTSDILRQRSEEFSYVYNTTGISFINPEDTVNSCYISLGNRSQCLYSPFESTMLVMMNPSGLGWTCPANTRTTAYLGVTGMIYSINTSLINFWYTVPCYGYYEEHWTFYYNPTCFNQPTPLPPTPRPTSFPPTPIPPTPAPGNGRTCCYYWSPAQKYQTYFCQLPQYKCPHIEDFQYFGNLTQLSCSDCPLISSEERASLGLPSSSSSSSPSYSSSSSPATSSSSSSAFSSSGDAVVSPTSPAAPPSSNARSAASPLIPSLLLMVSALAAIFH